MSKGGFRAFRGSAATAESYLLERDSARLDDYYREGVERAVEHGIVTSAGVEMGALSPEKFRAWMEHRDPVTGEVRGVFRQRRDVDPVTGEVTVGGTPLYQETIGSVSKSLSLAAAANPRVAEALVAAMSRATEAGVAAVAQHAVTRVGDIGQQRQVKLDRVEFTSVQHTTSRSGDPHYHRHVQLLPVGLVDGKWRALDGRVLYRQAARFNASFDLSVSRDEMFRRVLAAEGLTWQPGQGGGEIAEYVGLVDAFSSRRDQINVNRETLETQWRIAHPGQEPGPAQRQAWDSYAWAKERPTKEPARELTPEAVAERVGRVEPQNPEQVLYGQTAEQISPEAIAEAAIADLGQSQSAWSQADMRAAIDRRLAETYLIGEAGVTALSNASFTHLMGRSVNFFDEEVNVEGVRHYTSADVLAVDTFLTDSLSARGLAVGENGQVQAVREGFTLSDEQEFAAAAIAGTHELVVIQGAAGAGKTTMLQAAAESVQGQGRRLVVVSPTKRGALEAGDVLGTEGTSVHSLLYRAGASVDESGKWTLPDEWQAQPESMLMDAHTVLVVDEAGMLDQDTAAALHQYVDSQRVGTLVLTGDAAQLAAVGRGGYLARASQIAGVSLDLTDVRRFRTADGSIDGAYAELSLRMRDREDPEQIFTELVERGLVRVGTVEGQLVSVSETVALETQLGERSVVIAPTNAAAQQVNQAVFDRLVSAGVIDTGTMVLGRDGDRIAAGARVATRVNDRELGVANRQTWSVTHVNADGRITVKDEATGHHRTLDAGYVREHVQLAYAVTGHGAQGMTVDTAHTLLSDELDAAGAYVGLTRGRAANVLHVVGVDEEDAKAQFVDAFARDSADQGIEAAIEQAHREVEGLDVTGRGHIDAEVARLREQAARHEAQAEQMRELGERMRASVSEYETKLVELKVQQKTEFAEATAQIDAMQAQQQEWGTYVTQLQASLRGEAERDGQPVIDAESAAFTARQVAESAGMFAKRSAQREAIAREALWQERRDKVTERWGDAPTRFELVSWVRAAIERDPQLIDAKTSLRQCDVLTKQAEQNRVAVVKAQRETEMELRGDLLGTERGERSPRTLKDANRRVEQVEQRSVQHVLQAGRDRAEADHVEALPTEAAERFMSERAAARAAAAADQAARREAAEKQLRHATQGRLHRSSQSPSRGISY